ncbi:T-cell activation Rho GTPase-activating protein-like, partial [Grus americana]
FSFAAGGSSCSSRNRRRTRLPWPFALRRSPAAAQAPGQAGCGCSRALFGQPLAAVCGEEGTLPRPIQELLAVLQQEGPSTEGIFRQAASVTALRELREALDRGAEVELGRQPALLLAILLKDFLRSIPSKLLVNDLYEDWMAAMRRTSKEEKMAELKAVAEKLPAANVLLLKRLLSLLRRIARSAGTSRMSSSNLAICMGPSLLSPPHEDLLPLEAMLEATEKVKVLVEFLVENCRELFGEETAELCCPAAEESPAPRQSSRGPRLAEQSVPAVRAEPERQADASPRTPASLELGVLREAGGDTVVGSDAGEAPPALPPSTPESAADSPGRPEELASLSRERRFAGSPQAEGKRRERKRKQAWGEESESPVEETRRKKRAEVSGAGPKRRGRRVQEARRPTWKRRGGRRGQKFLGLDQREEAGGCRRPGGPGVYQALPPIFATNGSS